MFVDNAPGIYFEATVEYTSHLSKLLQRLASGANVQVRGNIRI